MPQLEGANLSGEILIKQWKNREKEKRDLPLHKLLFVPVEVTEEYSGYSRWVLKQRQRRESNAKLLYPLAF